ncbi:MAG: DNA cytosine methyltransferase [Actinomycetota bacterium]|nr:DNA cytosine methyltransferase [Actinomycetota bacterium]
MTAAHINAIDLFAGTGWGVACKSLGVVKEKGVEIMPEAVATREVNGMETIYRDVWDGLRLTKEQHEARYGRYGLKIASPPCQTFSIAGSGSGRAALDEVLEAIEVHAYKDADALIRFGEQHDMRTALVLTPLAYVWRDRPKLVVWEQVPTVLPVWEACAEVMREWGYDVKVEVLNAEQYGVPQTRKRAILVARLGGPVHLPIPTHSKYYPRTPEKLDAGVSSWVSMGSALGLEGFTAEKVMGRGMVERYGTRPGRPAESPAFAIRASAGGMEPGGFVLRSNYGTGGDASKRGERTIDQPAATLTSKADRMKWDGVRRLTAEEAATLQSYPASFTFTGKTFLQIGNAVPPLLAEAILAALVGIKKGR